MGEQNDHLKDKWVQENLLLKKRIVNFFCQTIFFLPNKILVQKKNFLVKKNCWSRKVLHPKIICVNINSVQQNLCQKQF